MCALGKPCNDGICGCSGCCLSDAECGPLEGCIQSVPGDDDMYCTEKLRLFYEGFEGQTPGVVSPTFEYSFWGPVPWTVKQAFDEFGANSGERSLRYYKVKPDDGYSHRNIWVPSVPPGGQTLLSFFARCSNGKVPWSLYVSLGGEVALTVTNAACNGFWHRYVADVSATPAGKTQLKFRMLRSTQLGSEVLLDDIAILVAACPEPFECASWKEESGECLLAAIEPGNCFIDLGCYLPGTSDPEVTCAVCKPENSLLDWTPDDNLCDDNDPATTDLCDPKATMGCFHY